MNIRKLTILLLIIITLFTTKVFAAEYENIYTIKEAQSLSKGIKYEKILKFTSVGWINVNVLRADLNNDYTKIKPITHIDGVSNRAPLSSMITSSGAIAAVNGDFFYMGDPTYTYGGLIDNGKLISSPLPMSYGYPTVHRMLSDEIGISIWNPKITLYGTNEELDITVINKTSSLEWGATILTSSWNKTSPGYDGSKDIIEIIVDNNIVKEIRKNQPPIEIPKNGFVIASSHSQTIEKLQNSFKVDNDVKIDIKLDFNPSEIEWAFGGLNYILKDGQQNEISNQVLGQNPRTAIGFNKENTEIIMVTVDGRSKSFAGIKQTELAQLMMELGAYNAVNMDGGGSTTMGIDFFRNSNIEIVNSPSENRERRIASGVGLFNSYPLSKRVNRIEFESEHNTIFNNTETLLKVGLFNEYETPVEQTEENIQYTISPAKAGLIENNVFKPVLPGIVNITAKSGSISNTIKIDVLDNPVSLKFNKDKISLKNGEVATLNAAMGIDKNGKTAPIPAKFLTYTTNNKIGAVEDGVFKASDLNVVGAITVKFKDAVENLNVKVGYRYKTLNRFEDLTNINLKLYPENSVAKISISEEVAKEGKASLKLDYDFNYFTDQSISFIELGESQNGIELESGAKKIGVWVFGDGKNHWLRMRLIDGNGSEIKSTFADKVDWIGWKWVEAEIPSNLQLPIKLKNIYLAEIDSSKKDSGTIYLDNLRVLYEPNDRKLGLEKETEYIDKMKTSEITSFTEKLTVTKDSFSLEQTDSLENIVLINVPIENKAISSFSTWDIIKKTENISGKNIVLSLSENIQNISDEREIMVLKKLLETTSQNNNVFVIYKGTQKSNTFENKVRYITYEEIFELGIVNNSPKYKN